MPIDLNNYCGCGEPFVPFDDFNKDCPRCETPADFVAEGFVGKKVGFAKEVVNSDFPLSPTSLDYYTRAAVEIIKKAEQFPEMPIHGAKFRAMCMHLAEETDPVYMDYRREHMVAFTGHVLDDLFPPDFENIIFDWSGVVSNDFEPVYLSVMEVFDRNKVPHISKEEFRSEFRLPYGNFYKKFIPNIDLEAEKAIFRQCFARQAPPQAYTESRDVLESLHKAGIKMVVLSSHAQSFIEEEAERYGVLGFLDEVNGSVHDKGEVIEGILKRNKFDPKKTGYVGDMMHDVHTAHKAGVASIGLPRGYQTPKLLATAHPRYTRKDLIGVERLVLGNRTQ